jgi:hypothetical protein
LLDQGYQYDEQVRNFVGDDPAPFMNAVKALTSAQRLAVIYKANAFWRAGKPLVDSPFEDEVIE